MFSMARMPVQRQIDLIIIHCSATPNGQRLNVQDIDRMHRARGFRRNPALIGYNNPQLTSIGYHFVIYINGAVSIGRGIEEIGAHARGFNKTSIGVCMVGTDRFTNAQWISLKANIEGLKRQFPQARIVGHRDLSPDLNGDGIIEPREYLKICPGFDVNAWLTSGKKALRDHLFAEESNESH